MSDDQPLVPVFIPPLVTVLAHAEAQKPGPLTQAEVLAIRDRSVCLMLPEEQARALIARRGPDIDPDNCWADWQQIREERAEADEEPINPFG
jgi:hypothetical protein